MPRLATVTSRIGSAALALALLGCEAGRDEEALVVFAASSLTEVVTAVDGDFERAHPGADVTASFAGSQVLQVQIANGAPADVLASADRRHVEALADAGLIEPSEVFAHNELVVIVPLEDPARIETFADLPRAERLVLGDPSVPVGRYTRAMLRRADAHLGAGFASAVLAGVVSQESNARLVRAKVELGEADAAIVYRTDAAASNRVRVVPIPDEANVRADYHVAVVAASPRRELARRWIAHLRSDAGRRILASHGFGVAGR